MKRVYKSKLAICFIGVDGTGKTTHAKLLCEHLLDDGILSLYQHLFSKHSVQKDLLHGHNIINTLIEYMGIITGLPTGNPIIDIFKITLRVFGIMLFSWIKFIHDKTKYTKNVIIYDRYFYDNLVIYASTFIRYSSLILTLARLIPMPSIVFLLMANPLSIMKRRKELDIKKIVKMFYLYERLGKLISAKIICTDIADINIMHKIIYNQVRQYLIK